jgi:hypothetical protein
MLCISYWCGSCDAVAASHIVFGIMNLSKKKWLPFFSGGSCGEYPIISVTGFRRKQDLPSPWRFVNFGLLLGSSFA